MREIFGTRSWRPGCPDRDALTRDHRDAAMTRRRAARPGPEDAEVSDSNDVTNLNTGRAQRDSGQWRLGRGNPPALRPVAADADAPAVRHAAAGPADSESESERPCPSACPRVADGARPAPAGDRVGDRVGAARVVAMRPRGPRLSRPFRSWRSRGRRPVESAGVRCGPVPTGARGESGPPNADMTAAYCERRSDQRARDAWACRAITQGDTPAGSLVS